jgi:SAM-dependent methyltransferase
VSGFSADWLDLREPADHRARNPGLASRLRQHLEGRDPVRIVDLGCGTGSNLRALAPHLPPVQQWRLIDHDPALLDEARRQIKAWSAEQSLSGLNAGFETADLTTDLERVLDDDCDVVTAAALFDLVSESWIERIVPLIADRACAFYTVLIYDGAISWEPAHAADEAIRGAFNAHQHQDKGFGPAAGPDAAQHLAEGFERAGYAVLTAPSPWRLTRDSLPLILATAEGIGGAARETCLVPDGDIAGWIETRHALEFCEIGHIDLLALPQ